MDGLLYGPITDPESKVSGPPWHSPAKKTQKDSQWLQKGTQSNYKDTQWPKRDDAERHITTEKRHITTVTHIIFERHILKP